MASYGPTTALIVVDVQNDFADPRGTLSVPGAEEAIAAINRELAEARAAGALVVYTQDWHPPVTPHFVTDGGIWPEHCIGGTWGAELHRALDALPEEPRIRKGVGGEDGYSGFTVADPVGGERSPTGLADLLGQRHIDTVVVVGLATDYCVKATALDARSLGFPTTVVQDAVRAVDLAEGDGATALAEIRAAGVTLR